VRWPPHPAADRHRRQPWAPQSSTVVIRGLSHPAESRPWAVAQRWARSVSHGCCWACLLVIVVVPWALAGGRRHAGATAAASSLVCHHHPGGHGRGVPCPCLFHRLGLDPALCRLHSSPPPPNVAGCSSTCRPPSLAAEPRGLTPERWKSAGFPESCFTLLQVRLLHTFLDFRCGCRTLVGSPVQVARLSQKRSLVRKRRLVSQPKASC